ncbi:Glucose-induced degradation protein 4-like protein [Hypsibius exemplaris]|uniref:Glucose-induced degradation protein 4-like protein n=1 Tax=Hypsibius exemplaris TaxID=2072580 RepID=A0A1W0W9P4_HYPEX|nr:Glucose-induced degradation protein 4-like protein [Hypsibius exemplaris]
MDQDSNEETSESAASSTYSTFTLYPDLEFLPDFTHQLSVVPSGARRLPGLPAGNLYSGAKFHGHQQSRGNSYDVEVILHNVDLETSYLCGFLKIKKLTKDFPELTTFFDGEVINEKHPFLTRKWDADEEVDRKHWGKFPSFLRYSKTFNNDGFSYDEVQNSDYIYMRWKEHFLVPDHTIREVTGASFAGFYYICLQKSLGKIEGYYYHRSSEEFQSLDLQQIVDYSHEVYQFR